MEPLIILPTDFSAEALKARKEWNDIFKVLKEKKLPMKNTITDKTIFQNEKKARLPDKQKLR